MENQQQPKKSAGRIFWIILICVLVAGFAYYLLTTTGKGTKISETQFIQQLEGEKVAKVELNSKVINITYKNGTKAWFYSRSSVEEYWHEYLLNNYNQNPDHQDSLVHVVPGTTSTFSIVNFLYIIFSVGLTIFIIIWLSRQIKGANKQSFDFVKNRARIGESVIKFSDVAGAEEEKQEVAEIVEFLKNPDKFRNIGARIPKGVLLVGPPGTGKTLLAKAIAGEANVPFFTISGSDFMELFVGVGASRVRDLFEQAKRVKPCIVFIDEIDAVGRQRGAGVGGGNDEREQTLNQLLVQMDGFEANEGIIVLAATNRADILDPALMRPGRFDRQVYIHIPDVRGREAILKVHARNKHFDKDVDFGVVARITSGFTGADLENLLNEAAILAARDNRTTISLKDISNGIDKVIMGPQKKSWIMSDKDKTRTAYHEAGHAIVQHYVKNSEPIHEVSIVPRGAAAGYTLSRPSGDDRHVTKEKLIDQIAMLLGGRVSEEIFLKDVSTGASNDIQRATDIARNMVTKWGMSEKIGLVCLNQEDEIFLGRDYQTRTTYSEAKANLVDDEIRSIIDKCKEQTEKLIKTNQKQLETLVKVLLEKETVYEDEIELVFKKKSAKAIIDYINDKNAKKEKINDSQATKSAQNVAEPTKVENVSEPVNVENEKQGEQAENEKAKEEIKSIEQIVQSNETPKQAAQKQKEIATNIDNEVKQQPKVVKTEIPKEEKNEKKEDLPVRKPVVKKKVAKSTTTKKTEAAPKTADKTKTKSMAAKTETKKRAAKKAKTTKDKNGDSDK